MEFFPYSSLARCCDRKSFSTNAITSSSCKLDKSNNRLAAFKLAIDFDRVSGSGILNWSFIISSNYVEFLEDWQRWHLMQLQLNQ
jgi:hypothetical protein